MTDQLNYQPQIQTIFANNKLADSQAALKHIAKLIQGINATPKSRQIPASNFIVKKFVTGVQGGKELFECLGFQQTTVNNTPYFLLPESHPTIAQASNIAADLLTISTTNPLASIPSSPDTSSSTDMVVDDSVTSKGTETDKPTESTTEEGSTKKEEAVAEPPKPCAKGCGFYGSSATDGMCSSCYKAEQKKATKPIVPSMTKSSFLSNLKPLGRPFAENKNKCATSKCPFHIWKDAPESWKQNLLKEWGGVASPDTVEASTTMGDESSQPSSKSITSQPEKYCQYCSYNRAREEFNKGQTSKTLAEKRVALGLKTRALGKMASQMRQVQLNKDRCWTCNRKVGITGFECKCNPSFRFCAAHRYPSAHECSYDHTSRYTSHLAKSTLNDIRTNKLDDDE